MTLPDAACRDTPPGIHHPDQRGGGQHYRDAKAICDTCPTATKHACLTTALAYEGGLSSQWRHGMWGGLTPEQRAQLTRKAAA